MKNNLKNIISYMKADSTYDRDIIVNGRFVDEIRMGERNALIYNKNVFVAEIDFEIDVYNNVNGVLVIETEDGKIEFHLYEKNRIDLNSYIDHILINNKEEL